MARKKIKCYTMDELSKKYKEWQKDMERMCHIEGDFIVFNLGFEYNIALNRCDTPVKILGWIAHLCEKTWMTCDLIDRFILLATTHHKINIYTGA